MGAAALGTKLGRYQIVKHLASGGMAEVLLARASGIEGFARHVVIKRIRQGQAGDASFVQMFLNEARLAAQLHHHHIVQVHDIGQEGNEYFFAMEYVHGEDLRRLMTHLAKHKQKLPLEHVVTIITAAATALHHAHEQLGPDRKPLGIVHRDVSPANILVGYDGSVKVADFGIAKAAARTAEVTQAGTLKGKASYMSPEQCTGSPTLDRRSDVFSLGIVLYEIATTRRLFKAESDFLTMSAIVSGKIPSPREQRPDIPLTLEAIILKALAHNPAERFQTADEMRIALDAFATAAQLRTTTGGLAAFMKAQFGEKPEPWLVESADNASGANADDASAAAANTPDFDGSASGVASAPQQSVENLDIPDAVAVTSDAPILRARTKAISVAPPMKKPLPPITPVTPVVAPLPAKARALTHQIPARAATTPAASDKPKFTRRDTPVPIAPQPPARKRTITVQIPVPAQSTAAQARASMNAESSGVPLPGVTKNEDSAATAVSGVPKDVDSSWDTSQSMPVIAAASTVAGAPKVSSASTSKSSPVATSASKSGAVAAPSASSASSSVPVAAAPASKSGAVAAPNASSGSKSSPVVAPMAAPKKWMSSTTSGGTPAADSRGGVPTAASTAESGAANTRGTSKAASTAESGAASTSGTSKTASAAASTAAGAQKPSPSRTMTAPLGSPITNPSSASTSPTTPPTPTQRTATPAKGVAPAPTGVSATGVGATGISATAVSATGAAPSASPRSMTPAKGVAPAPSSGSAASAGATTRPATPAKGVVPTSSKTPSGGWAPAKFLANDEPPATHVPTTSKTPSGGWAPAKLLANDAPPATHVPTTSKTPSGGWAAAKLLSSDAAASVPDKLEPPSSTRFESNSEGTVTNVVGEDDDESVPIRVDDGSPSAATVAAIQASLDIEDSPSTVTAVAYDAAMSTYAAAAADADDGASSTSGRPYRAPTGDIDPIAAADFGAEADVDGRESAPALPPPPAGYGRASSNSDDVTGVDAPFGGRAQSNVSTIFGDPAGAMSYAPNTWPTGSRLVQTRDGFLTKLRASPKRIALLAGALCAGALLAFALRGGGGETAKPAPKVEPAKPAVATVVDEDSAGSAAVVDTGSGTAAVEQPEPPPPPPPTPRPKTVIKKPPVKRVATTPKKPAVTKPKPKPTTTTPTTKPKKPAWDPNSLFPTKKK